MATPFSVSPDPCCRGEDATISVDKNAAGVTLPMTIDVTFTPPGTTQHYTLTAAKPSVTVSVPSSAGSLVVHDQNSGVDDLTTSCTKCSPDAEGFAPGRKPPHDTHPRGPARR